MKTHLRWILNNTETPVKQILKDESLENLKKHYGAFSKELSIALQSSSTGI